MEQKHLIPITHARGDENINIHIAGCYGDLYPYPSTTEELFPEQSYLLLCFFPIVTCLIGILLV
jgi:hypothetical protein